MPLLGSPVILGHVPSGVPPPSSSRAVRRAAAAVLTCREEERQGGGLMVASQGRTAEEAGQHTEDRGQARQGRQ